MGRGTRKEDFRRSQQQKQQQPSYYGSAERKGYGHVWYNEWEHAAQNWCKALNAQLTLRYFFNWHTPEPKVLVHLRRICGQFSIVHYVSGRRWPKFFQNASGANLKSPNVNETPRSFSAQPVVSLSGSAHNKSQSRPVS